MQPILFISKKERAEAGALEAELNQYNFRVVDFFTSIVDELAVVSKHRIVHVPTFIVINHKNKVLARLVRMPTLEEATKLIQDCLANESRELNNV